MEKITNLLCRPGEDLKGAVAKKLRVAPEKIGSIRILKRSIDARKKPDVFFVITAEVYKKGETPPSIPKDLLSAPQRVAWNKPPVAVAGAGPCGLFCALKLAKSGVPVLLFERGDDVDRRKERVQTFCTTRSLDPDSNVQFGEGGAGTFSDGKLNTQIKSPLVEEVLATFVSFGAPEEILWENKPHIGSDRLPAVVKAMREEIVRLGGRVFFRTPVTDFSVQKGKITSVTAGGNKYEASALVLAIGHSARDTFRTLYGKGCAMEQKAFAVGVRVEHLQQQIGLSQYGKAAKLLPPADYKLTSMVNGRGVYSFCMCPGGTVVAAASEEGRLVVNGMSNYKRDGVNANAALVAQVRAEDYGEGVFAGLTFQERLEERAFAVGGGNYAAPICRMEDFLAGKRTTRIGEIAPTYPLGYTFARVDDVLGESLANVLRAGATDMERRLKGFTHPDALLTCVETRTSSPVRILRGENMQSLTHSGLYPAGEGAGYAGGIASAAVDGLKIADAILQEERTFAE